MLLAWRSDTCWRLRVATSCEPVFRHGAASPGKIRFMSGQTQGPACDGFKAGYSSTMPVRLSRFKAHVKEDLIMDINYEL